ncbi:MAG: nuclear transport factor 2 family protein [Lautropia sp.]
MSAAVAPRPAGPGIEVRHAIEDLMAEYGLLIDENRLEEWVALFDDACDYRVITRENVEQGLPNVMIWCDNRAMLRDRVESYRHVNEYNLHWDRHVIGPLRHCGQVDGAWRIEAGYSLAQTTLEGRTTLFSVGRYRCDILVDGAGARFRSVLVIVDTALVPSLLATPI